MRLYDRDIRNRREGWFREWLITCKDPMLEDILHFHQFTGDGDQHNDLLMNRGGELYTVSITGMKIGKENGEMMYRDLRNNRISISGLMFSPCPSVQ
jgi:hypothetical protein